MVLASLRLVDHPHSGAGTDVLYGYAGDDDLWLDDAYDSFTDATGVNLIHYLDTTMAWSPSSGITSGSGTEGGFAWSLASGTLTITGTSGADAITLETDGVSGLEFGTVVINAATVRSIVITALAGNDTIDLADIAASRVPDVAAITVYGGDGEDEILGSAVHDVLYGGADNDILHGGAGSDTLSGDDGNDLLDGDEDEDWLFGGAGNDELVLDDFADLFVDSEGENSVTGDGAPAELDPEALFDPTNEGVDIANLAGEEDDEFTCTGGGSGSGSGSGNHKPEFEGIPNISSGCKEYIVTIHRGKSIGFEVLKLKATDEDSGQTLEYTFVGDGGNTEGVFALNQTTGKLSLAKDAVDTQTDEYNLVVRVTDNGSPAEYDQVTVNVIVLDAVGMIADTHSTEGITSDTLHITFVRFARDISAALTVNYSLDWEPTDVEFATPASPADFYDFLLDDLVNLQSPGSGSIVIPANSRESIAINLAAKKDGNPGGVAEGIEVFNITIDDSDDYAALDGSALVNDSQYIKAYSSLDFFVSDDYTLYGPDNKEPSLKDGDNDPQTPLPPLPAGNPGIHLNDINQGKLGDCFIMAALGAIARDQWRLIYDAITPISTTTPPNLALGYKIKLYEITESIVNNQSIKFAYEREFRFGLASSRGPNAAEFSGDFDTLGRSELWPQIVESALAALFGGYALVAGNNTATIGLVWQAFIGIAVQIDQATNDVFAVSDMSSSSTTQIRDKIAELQTQNMQIVITTPPVLASDTLVSSNRRIYANHCYVVESTIRDQGGNITGFVLYDPHGPGNEITMTVAELDDYVQDVWGLKP